jgi:hypothetical protein
MAQKKFKIYDALKKQLCRKGVEAYGSNATLLLDWGLNPKTNSISSKTVEAAKACKEGEFTKVWRPQMEKLGYLTCSVEKLKNGKERWHYSPGPALRVFLNKEKLNNDVVATMSDISDVRKELADIRVSLKGLIEIIDPPSSDEKVDRFLKDTMGYVESLPEDSKLIKAINRNKNLKAVQ